MPYFDETYNCSKANEPLMPFFHSCDGYHLKSILLTEQLATKECPVFNKEKLLYLFYGRPAYKNSIQESSSSNFYLPVCFILDGNYLPKSIKRVFPFDTGAFNSGLYDNHLHHHMTMEQFLMTPDTTSITKTISYFFDTNENYYKGEPKSDIDYDILNFPIEAYRNLISAAQLGKADDRKASVEIQLADNLPLNGDIVKAVVMPACFTTSPLVKNIVIDKWQVDILPYKSFGSTKPDHYYSQILNLVEEFNTKLA
jgi:hypothetical protein